MTGFQHIFVQNFAKFEAKISKFKKKICAPAARNSGLPQTEWCNLTCLLYTDALTRGGWVGFFGHGLLRDRWIVGLGARLLGCSLWSLFVCGVILWTHALRA